ncbi:MAG: hypothetical protein HY075_16595 [Deltaproteobacteria bacterium]|nr:hypothetical protein [Deltaproteobacteria bacterium]
MSFSWSSLAAGFFFGVWGMFLIKRAKRESHLPSLLIGLALIVYPYLVENSYALWGIGFGLLFAAYRLAKY